MVKRVVLTVKVSSDKWVPEGSHPLTRIDKAARSFPRPNLLMNSEADDI
jgi:hypothetical protein